MSRGDEVVVDRVCAGDGGIRGSQRDQPLGETGLSERFLSRWLREARVRSIADDKDAKKEERSEDWAEKFAAVLEASLGAAELGKFLRREG